MQQHLHCSSLLEESGEYPLGAQPGVPWEAACSQLQLLMLGLDSEKPPVLSTLCSHGHLAEPAPFPAGAGRSWAVPGTGTSASGVTSTQGLRLWGPWERSPCSARVRYQLTSWYLTWALGFWTLSLNEAQASLGGHRIITFPERLHATSSAYYHECIGQESAWDDSSSGYSNQTLKHQI